MRLLKSVAIALTMLLVAAPVVAQSPSPSVSVEQQAFLSMQAVVSKQKANVGAGLELYSTDELAKPIVEKAFIAAAEAMEAAVVYDCFKEWFAFEYASLFIVAKWFSTVQSNDVFKGPASDYLQAALDLTQFANYVRDNRSVC